MLSPEIHKNHWMISVLLAVIYYFLSSVLDFKPMAFMRLSQISGMASLYFVVFQPTTELTANAYKLAAGVHLLCLGVYTPGIGVPQLIGARHAYLVHYWMVYNALGFFESLRRRAPESRSNAFRSVLTEFSRNPGLSCLIKTLAFIVCSAFFFLFVLVGFTLTELITGAQIRRDPPGLYEVAFFAIFSKMGMLLAEYFYFLLMTTFGLFEGVE
ncbi:unnamed protein product [Clonostachys rhizophaga]|uniref:Uncharacterized protein n=1 Tax=Clonostachys rhizophaga TaxID=160324 RepID=A0A9N9VQV2_9HYPO|nr:unnamed protein product [Clonostachys rhizophaga]